MEFASNGELQRIADLAREFFDHVLFDEEPLFVSDEASVGDVSMGSQEELIKRCSEYYGTSISAHDLNQPLWKLIRQLNESRRR
jgi:hypothetical protein